MDNFAVIYTETNWIDEVMSIGVVVAGGKDKEKYIRRITSSIRNTGWAEYSKYEWYDIMRLAVYRQYNQAIPDCADCYKTGKLKRGYGVEDVLKMFRKNKRYDETHNAVLDARDELEIMQLLGYGLDVYEVARLK